MSFCSQCGRQLSDDTKFCPSCGHSVGKDGMAAQPESTTPEQGKERCPDCGTAYSAGPNKLLATLLIVFGVVMLFIWMIIGIALLVVGILYRKGMIPFLYTAKCPKCGKRPVQVSEAGQKNNALSHIGQWLAKLTAWRDTKLSARPDNSVTRTLISLNEKQENIFKGKLPMLLALLTLVPFVLYCRALFASHTLEGFVLGIQTSERDMMYIDAVLNFASIGLNILVWIVPGLYLLTAVSFFIPKARLNGLALLSGVLTMAGTLCITGLNHQAEHGSRSTYNALFDETVTTEYIYDLGATNSFLIIGGILLLVMVCLAFLVENERHYMKLRSSGGLDR